MSAPAASATGRLGGVVPGVLAVAVAAPQGVGGAVAPLVVMVGLGVFLLVAFAYATLARQVPEAGGLYAYVARGLGRPAGLGAAWLSLAAYHAVQAGLYGVVGAVAAPLVDVPWWVVAGACWGAVAVAGLLPVRVTAALVGLVVLAEVAVAGWRTVVHVRAQGWPGWAAWQVDVPRPELGLLLLGGALAFVGFETVAAYGAEARRSKAETRESGAEARGSGAGARGGRAVPRAAYGAILVLTLLFAAVAVGSGELPGWTVVPGRWLLVAGLVAGALAVHLAVVRLLAALGRERVFPAGLGGLRAASLTQSASSGLILGAFVALGTDPAGGWAGRLGLAGGLGVLVLLVGTALAALFVLNRQPAGEGPVRRLVAPVIAVLGLGTLVWLGAVHHGFLLVAATAPMLVGLAHAAALRLTQPVVYAGIGLGGRVIVVTPDPAALTAVPGPAALTAVPGPAALTAGPERDAPESAVVAHPRMPGAHRPERISRGETAG